METQTGKFKLGRTVITPGAMETIQPEDVMEGESESAAFYVASYLPRAVQQFIQIHLVKKRK